MTTKTLKIIFFSPTSQQFWRPFEIFPNTRLAYPVLSVHSSQKDRVSVFIEPWRPYISNKDIYKGEGWARATIPGMTDQLTSKKKKVFIYFVHI